MNTRTSRLDALAFHLQEVSEAEKTRLARELHDALGSCLTAIKMDVAWVRGRLVPEQGVLIDKLERAMKTLDQAIQKKRQIIEELRPTTLGSFGLATAARELAEQTAERVGWTLRLEMPADDPDLPEAVEITLFRALQEALANAAKHANATRVSVSLECVDDACSLVIEDDGAGFDPAEAQPRSYGLLAIRHRVEGRGGALEITSRPRHGTTWRVSIPCTYGPTTGLGIGR